MKKSWELEVCASVFVSEEGFLVGLATRALKKIRKQWRFRTPKMKIRKRFEESTGTRESKVGTRKEEV